MSRTGFVSAGWEVRITPTVRLPVTLGAWKRGTEGRSRSLSGAEHILGGIMGYDAAETTDESPERLALVQRLTWAYLRSALYPDDPAWPEARAAFANLSDLGRIESK